MGKGEGQIGCCYNEHESQQRKVMDMGCVMKRLSSVFHYLKVTTHEILYASTPGKTKTKTKKTMKHQPPQTQPLHHLKYDYLGPMCFSY